MIDLTPDRRGRNRSRDQRVTISAAVPLPIASLLDDAVERLGTNRNRLICAVLELALPLVEAQVKAASAGRQE